MSNKIILDIIKESSESENFNFDSVMGDEIIGDFSDTYADVNTLPANSDMIYSAESIPLFNCPSELLKESVVGLIEADILDKFMVTNRIRSVVDALNELAVENGIPNGDGKRIAIVFESDDEAEEAIDEVKNAKSSSKKSKLKILNKASKFIKDAKNNGIKVFKKNKK